jgi:hypothetical protein
MSCIRVKRKMIADFKASTMLNSLLIGVLLLTSHVNAELCYATDNNQPDTCVASTVAPATTKTIRYYVLDSITEVNVCLCCQGLGYRNGVSEWSPQYFCDFLKLGVYWEPTTAQLPQFRCYTKIGNRRSTNFNWHFE